MSAFTSAPTVRAFHEDTLVATLVFGQRTVIHDAAEAPKLRELLTQSRFVYNPDTRQLRVVGERERATQPGWWLAHVQEALWPHYDLTVEYD
jgi:hypothetical protein